MTLRHHHSSLTTLHNLSSLLTYLLMVNSPLWSNCHRKHQSAKFFLPRSSLASASLPKRICTTSIAISTDKLFFVRYFMPDTLWPQWYLVQVDKECTMHDPFSQHFTASGKYYVHFQCQHFDNVACSILTNHWCPIWHEYTIADNNIINFGKSVNT